MELCTIRAAMSDYLPRSTSEKEELLRADITARLRGVCSEWTESEFRELVDKIVRTSIGSYYSKAALPPVRRSTT
jgi:hypothetical protein